MAAASQAGLAYARSTELAYFKRWHGWFMYQVRQPRDAASITTHPVPDFAARFFTRHYLGKEPVTEEDSDAFENEVIAYLAALYDRDEAVLPPEAPREPSEVMTPEVMTPEVMTSGAMTRPAAFPDVQAAGAQCATPARRPVGHP
jgi:hypothetical protein